MVSLQQRLMPVYLLADDGRLYEARSVSGRVNGVRWWLRFDDAGNSVLTVEKLSAHDSHFAYRAVCDSLKASGVKVKIGRHLKTVGDRSEYDASVMAPLPASLFRAGGAWQPRGDCVVYSFGKTWG